MTIPPWARNQSHIVQSYRRSSCQEIKYEHEVSAQPVHEISQEFFEARS